MRNRGFSVTCGGLGRREQHSVLFSGSEGILSSAMRDLGISIHGLEVPPLEGRLHD
jgi:hypothetical protein